MANQTLVFKSIFRVKKSLYELPTKLMKNFREETKLILNEKVETRNHFIKQGVIRKAK
jgi:hypothetical protein